ncbi:MMPL family transporter [Dactylosporangium aurantiacum]|uniref:MMPL family transporter n=1 Tax=Dactylosporangium aurantiacum TaxID=35754 RepID=A0A9Q9I7B6_9ACTN|nr:MMPL family transporter [Dactylosporangium aurantiacum]MDG6106508.1 MMPL family transporter [Dactylosporangium aurantiacum]UWZ50461.1 MMPL family transporter [Dactylosporangium aurantiacum]
MATVLYRLGRASFRHRWLVLIIWVVVLGGLGGAAAAFRGPTSSDFTMPGTESQRAIDALKSQFPEASGATGTIVVAAPQGQPLTASKAAVDGLVAEAAKLPGVLGALDPFQTGAVSQNGQYALITVQFADRADKVTDEQRDAYEASGAAARQAGLRVEHGGEVMNSEPEVGGTEAIGVVIALVVLVVTFGALVAAGMTMLNALIGVGAGMAGLYALSGAVQLTSTAPVLALMLGLAVGIDYSLFITSRHRQNLVDGLAPDEAAGRAVGTAGSAVVFAGATVVIALAGLAVVNIPFLTVMGLAAAGTVAVAVLVAITLQPALLGFAGLRILPRRLRKAGAVDAAAAKEAAGFGFRWARAITRLRVPVLLVGVIGLGALAIPAADMRIALPGASAGPTDSPARKAADLIEQGFGPGFNGRLALVVSTDSADTTKAKAQEALGVLQGTPNLLAATPPNFSRDGKTALLAVIPKTGPTDEATETLVHDVRAKVRQVQGADIALTGQTAVGIDVSEKLSDAMPRYLLLVVGLSVLLLMLVFRSILVPLKAAAGFLLTVGATFGITVLVFQKGHLASLVGLDTPGPLVSFLPILLIGILFGLAMDYEVFLVSRMREDYVHGAGPQEATISGMGHGARVVTAAALIMTSVFAGFILLDDPVIKSMGFALAIGVAIDAFIVRMTIVPAVVSLLGRAAWWLPGWLSKLLPNVDIEGEKLREHLAAHPDPEPVRV